MYVFKNIVNMSPATWIKWKDIIFINIFVSHLFQQNIYLTSANYKSYCCYRISYRSNIWLLQKNWMKCVVTTYILQSFYRSKNPVRFLPISYSKIAKISTSPQSAFRGRWGQWSAIPVTNRGGIVAHLPIILSPTKCSSLHEFYCCLLQKCRSCKNNRKVQFNEQDERTWALYLVSLFLRMSFVILVFLVSCTK